METYLHYPA